MHISLLIRLQTDELVSWATFDRKGRIINSAVGVPLNEVPTDNYQPLVLIPSTDILLTEANVPSTNRQKIIQAVPYALEEQLIDDVDNLHFVMGKPLLGNIPVAVIAKTSMENYLQRLQAAGFKPIALQPDVLAVPHLDDGWTLMYLDDIVLVRTGLYAGFAIEADSINVVLPMAIAENPPTQITVINHTDLTSLPTLGIPIQTAEDNILAGINHNALNLLQGTYSPKNKSWLRPWLLTIALCLIWGGLYVTEQIIDYRHLTQQRQFLNQQITTTYQEAFPEARRIVNPRVQMEQKLTELRKQQQINEVFLTTLTTMTPIFKTIPNLTIKRIDFRNKQFDLQLTVKNFSALEKLQTSLNKLNLTVKVKSATSQNQLVASRLQISITQ